MKHYHVVLGKVIMISTPSINEAHDNAAKKMAQGKKPFVIKKHIKKRINHEKK